MRKYEFLPLYLWWIIAFLMAIVVVPLFIYLRR